jgi:diguanylate cyclase (GGDEF)-like protein
MPGSPDWSRLRAMVPTVAWLAVPILATGVLRVFDALRPASAGASWLLPVAAGIVVAACAAAAAAAFERSLRRSAAWLIPALAYAIVTGGLAGAVIGTPAASAAFASAATILLVGAVAIALRADLPAISPIRAGLALVGAGALVAVLVTLAPRDTDPLRPVIGAGAVVACVAAALVGRARWETVLGLGTAAALVGIARTDSVEVLIAYGTAAGAAIGLVLAAVDDQTEVQTNGGVGSATSLPQLARDLPAPILLFDGHLRLRDWNRAAGDLLDLTSRDLRIPLDALLGASLGELTGGSPPAHARRGASGEPLELSFIPLEGAAVVVVRDPGAPAGPRLEIDRLTRELRATIEELIQARRTIELQRAEIERATAIDALTAVESREAIVHRLRIETAQAQRYDHPVAVAVIDVDDFAALNREHGLEVGDAVLREVALRLRLRIRQTDALGRIGGDAFLAIMPHTDEAGAVTLAEGLRQRLAQRPLTTPDGEVAIHASFGVAVMHHGDALDPDLLLARADAGLAAARHRGGDAVALDPALRLRLRARPETEEQPSSKTQDSGR